MSGVLAVLPCPAPPQAQSLERRLAWLRAAGVSSAVVCVPFGAKSLHERFGDGSQAGVSLRFFLEPRPLGDAGCVTAQGTASLPDDVLVLEGDEAPKLDGARLLAFHRDHGALATLVVHRCRHGRGCRPVVLGPDRRIVELPPRPLVGAYAFGLSPLWIVRRPLLRLAGEERPCDFVADVFSKALKAGEPLAGFCA